MVLDNRPIVKYVVVLAIALAIITSHVDHRVYAQEIGFGACTANEGGPASSPKTGMDIRGPSILRFEHNIKLTVTCRLEITEAFPGQVLEFSTELNEIRAMVTTPEGAFPFSDTARMSVKRMKGSTTIILEGRARETVLLFRDEIGLEHETVPLNPLVLLAISLGSGGEDPEPWEESLYLPVHSKSLEVQSEIEALRKDASGPQNQAISRASDRLLKGFPLDAERILKDIELIGQAESRSFTEQWWWGFLIIGLAFGFLFGILYGQARSREATARLEELKARIRRELAQAEGGPAEEVTNAVIIALSQ